MWWANLVFRETTRKCGTSLFVHAFVFVPLKQMYKDRLSGRGVRMDTLAYVCRRRVLDIVSVIIMTVVTDPTRRTQCRSDMVSCSHAVMWAG